MEGNTEIAVLQFGNCYTIVGVNIACAVKGIVAIVAAPIRHHQRHIECARGDLVIKAQACQVFNDFQITDQVLACCHHIISLTRRIYGFFCAGIFVNHIVNIFDIATGICPIATQIHKINCLRGFTVQLIDGRHIQGDMNNAILLYFTGDAVIRIYTTLCIKCKVAEILIPIGHQSNMEILAAFDLVIEGHLANGLTDL